MEQVPPAGCHTFPRTMRSLEERREGSRREEEREGKLRERKS